MSIVSGDAEPLRCGHCQDAVNVLGHLEENAECREAAMRERLPWNEDYVDDKGLLLFDLSLVFECCLNTGGCPLPNGVTETNSRHLCNSDVCHQFYLSAPVLRELNAKTDTAAGLTEWLRNRRTKLRKKKSAESQRFLALMSPELQNRCHKCGLQGSPYSHSGLGWFVVNRGETARMVCKKPLCQGDGTLDYDPNALSYARGNASIVPGKEDHLGVIRVETKNALLFMPACNLRGDIAAQLNEGMDSAKKLVVALPNTVAATQTLEAAAKRAECDWANIKSLTNATLAPRTMLLTNYGQLIHAVSLMHRHMLATYRKRCIDRLTQMKNTATGPLTRSPYKTDATFMRPKFSNVEPMVLPDVMPWCESAQAIRLAESESRSAFNGRVKTRAQIRLLSEETELWSEQLKTIIAKSFGRDVTDAGSGKIVTCEDSCDPMSCDMRHPGLDAFLSEQMSGLARLARIPLILNYLKIKIRCLQKTALEQDCSHFDFKIIWDKFSWNVVMIGHMWSKRRRSLNEKVARNWYPRDIDIVRRVLVRSEDMETVSLDPGNLERR